MNCRGTQKVPTSTTLICSNSVTLQCGNVSQNCWREVLQRNEQFDRDIYALILCDVYIANRVKLVQPCTGAITACCGSTCVRFIFSSKYQRTCTSSLEVHVVTKCYAWKYFKFSNAVCTNKRLSDLSCTAACSKLLMKTQGLGSLFWTECWNKSGDQSSLDTRIKGYKCIVFCVSRSCSRYNKKTVVLCCILWS